MRFSLSTTTVFLIAVTFGSTSVFAAPAPIATGTSGSLSRRVILSSQVSNIHQDNSRTDAYIETHEIFPRGRMASHLTNAQLARILEEGKARGREQAKIEREETLRRAAMKKAKQTEPTGASREENSPLLSFNESAETLVGK